MKIIDQHAKKIMEDCKIKAKKSGLLFDNETLEYIVTNKDLLELSPKVMIPTLYDYWVHDVEVLKNKGQYKLYPSNPYETVINSRPAISFYNDNNPDWLNTMIFYHVLGHIDFFQNNKFFKHTWGDDFVGYALSDKRLIESYRSKYGRWTDYLIEFSRNVDNLAEFRQDSFVSPESKEKLFPSKKIEYYFDEFLQNELSKNALFIYKEIERYNDILSKNPDLVESIFFSDIKNRYPEFDAKYETFLSKTDTAKKDVMEFIRDNSPFLRKDNNRWMKSVINVVRNTSLYFRPQMRTKIINEGWASFWHNELFLTDDTIKKYESSYAKINSFVTSISRVGLNPYAIGMRLFEYIEELGNKGKISYDYQKIDDINLRDEYDKKLNKGRETIFKIRENFSDFMLIKTFVDQDFVDKYNLFVVGKRYDEKRKTIQYYVKSKKAEDYKQMLIDSLYHPPHIEVDEEKTTDEKICLKHFFEKKQLIKDFISGTMEGISYLWGGNVELETTEIVKSRDNYEYRKVIYLYENKKLTKRNL